jgi:hypothetical protein
MSPLSGPWRMRDECYQSCWMMPTSGIVTIPCAAATEGVVQLPADWLDMRSNMQSTPNYSFVLQSVVPTPVTPVERFASITMTIRLQSLM